MSSALSKVKFFEWLADFMGTHFNFGDNPMMALIIIGAISIAVRYLFASGSAYVVAMLPVFLTVGKVAGVNPMGVVLVTSCYKLLRWCVDSLRRCSGSNRIRCWLQHS